MRAEEHAKAGQNILQSQDKQWHEACSTNKNPGWKRGFIEEFKEGRPKRGKFSFKWLGPYIVNELSNNGLCTLTNKSGNVLKKV